MPRLLVILIPLVALAFAAIACDNDGGADSPEPSTPIASPTTQPELAQTQTTASNRAPVTVTQIDNETEFLDQFADQRIIQQTCTLDAATAEVDCAGDGLYQPDPPPAQDAACAVLVIDQRPIAVTCTIQEPLSVTYYEVPQ
jgi:hypothetical protein